MNRKNAPEATHEAIEYGTDLILDFDKLKKVANCGEPVVPVAVQDSKTREVLIVAYVNELALKYTLEHNVAAFWSTSRNELWVKGKTSGDTLNIDEVRVNCEQNSLVYLVTLAGKGSCHTKNEDGSTRFGCYYRTIKDGKLEFVDYNA